MRRFNDDIELSFVCPENWDKMDPVEGGRFCDRCQNCVFDYSAETIRSIQNDIASRQDDSNVCGNFRPYQVDSSLSIWKKGLLDLYFNLSVRKRKGKVILGLLVSLLFLVGCSGHRHTGGKNIRGKVKKVKGFSSYENPDIEQRERS